MKRVKMLIVALVTVMSLSAAYGCSRSFLGGAAVGAGAAGGAYEYQNTKALDQLDKDFEAGRISKDEYLRRKEEIKNRSLLH